MFAIIVYLVMSWIKFAKARKKFMYYPIAFLTIVMTVGLIVHGSIIIYIATNDTQDLSNYAFDLDQLQQEHANIEIYDQKGENPYTVVQDGVNRENISINEVPEYLKDAFVSVEDKTFYQHSGISVRGYIRAVYYKVLRPKNAMHGGSTLTQQLVKNINGDIYDRTVLHKYQEALVAVLIENKYEKEDILEMYLNRIFLGRGDVYGIGTASKVYFDKHVSQLTLAESAFLAGLPQAPSAYTENMELGNERKNTVLDVMKENGFITESQWKKAREEHIILKDSVVKTTEQTYMDAYVDYVLNEAKEVYGLTETQLKQNGYHIYTYLDTNLQAQMEQTVTNYSFQDGNDVQVAMAAIDNSSRKITALYGGKGYLRGFQNRAVSRYQPGSILKPLIIYAPALDSGRWGAYSEVLDEKKDFGGYAPKNAGEKYEGPISLERALVRSANVPAVSIFEDIGVEKGIQTLEKLHIPFEEKDEQLHLALGGMEKGVTVVEMAQAYSVFPNYGYFEPAFSIKYIKDENGKYVDPIKEIENQGEDIFTPETAYHITEMLQKVVTSESGTGQNASINHPVAGKTGTAEEVGTSGNRDAWFVGYTPQVTLSVHLGFDEPSAEHYLTTSGGGDPAKIFASVAGNHLANATPKSFTIPEGVEPLAGSIQLEKVTNVKATLDKEAGVVRISWNKLPNLGGVVYQVFKEGEDGEDLFVGETKDTFFNDTDVVVKETYLPMRDKPNPFDDFEGWVEDWKRNWKENVEVYTHNAVTFTKNSTFKLEHYYIVAHFEGQQSPPSKKTWTVVSKIGG